MKKQLFWLNESQSCSNQKEISTFREFIKYQTIQASKIGFIYGVTNLIDEAKNFFGRWTFEEIKAHKKPELKIQISHKTKKQLEHKS